MDHVIVKIFVVLAVCAQLASTTRCPWPCKEDACDVQTGLCLHGCSDGYYRSGSYCLGCPSNCAVCHSPGNCDMCDLGFYGHICNYSCHLCVDSQCAKNGCSKGCIPGYFTNDVSSFAEDGLNYTECHACPPNCISCNSIDHCTQCIDTYSGPTCSCKNCPETVVKPSTTLNTPSCGVQSFVTSNDQCVPCPPNCLSCRSDTECTKCRKGYYDSTCSSFNCSSIKNCEKCICLKSNCNRHEYICTHCREGHHGLPHCQFRCNPNCGQDGACDTEGRCLHGCKRGYWDDFCTLRCSVGCINDECNHLTGHCECKPGYSVTGIKDHTDPMCELVVSVKGNELRESATSRPVSRLFTLFLIIYILFILM